MDAQQAGKLVGQLLADNLGNRITVALTDGIVLHVMQALQAQQPTMPPPAEGSHAPDRLPA
jgi:hypothetical protein